MRIKTVRVKSYIIFDVDKDKKDKQASDALGGFFCRSFFSSINGVLGRLGVPTLIRMNIAFSSYLVSFW